MSDKTVWTLTSPRCVLVGVTYVTTSREIKPPEMKSRYRPFPFVPPTFSKDPDGLISVLGFVYFSSVVRSLQTWTDSRTSSVHPRLFRQGTHGNQGSCATETSSLTSDRVGGGGTGPSPRVTPAGGCRGPCRWLGEVTDDRSPGGHVWVCYQSSRVVIGGTSLSCFQWSEVREMSTNSSWFIVLSSPDSPCFLT